MNIDRQVFAHQMGILADRVGRDLKAPTLRAYYQTLCESLTTEQFVAATTIAFRTVSGEFRTWPSPTELIELVIPTTKQHLSAVDAFERVLAITNDPRIPLEKRESMIAELGAEVQRSYRAAGGRREFENVLESEVKWLRKNFLEAYAASSEVAESERTAMHALASANAQVRALVDATAGKLSSPLSKQLAPGATQR